jgi:hypothetical protein
MIGKSYLEELQDMQAGVYNLGLPLALDKHRPLDSQNRSLKHRQEIIVHMHFGVY